MSKKKIEDVMIIDEDENDQDLKADTFDQFEDFEKEINAQIEAEQAEGEELTAAERSESDKKSKPKKTGGEQIAGGIVAPFNMQARALGIDGIDKEAENSLAESYDEFLSYWNTKPSGPVMAGLFALGNTALIVAPVYLSIKSRMLELQTAINSEAKNKAAEANSGDMKAEQAKDKNEPVNNPEMSLT